MSAFFSMFQQCLHHSGLLQQWHSAAFSIQHTTTRKRKHSFSSCHLIFNVSYALSYTWQVMTRRRSLKSPSALGPDPWLTCSWRKKQFHCLKPAPFSSLAPRTSQNLTVFAHNTNLKIHSIRISNLCLSCAYICLLTGIQVQKAVLQDHQCFILHQLNPAVHPALLHLPGSWGPYWSQVLQKPGDILMWHHQTDKKTVGVKTNLRTNLLSVLFFQILAYADIVFTTVFTIEIVLKVS